VYRIFGLRPQDFAATYEAFLDIVHSDDRAFVDAAYQESIKERNDGYQIEHRIIRRDTGEIRIVHEKCEHLKDASGRIVRSIGMVQDITDRKRSEEALRESEEKFRVLFEKSIQGILAADLEANRFVYANPRICRMLGYSETELLQLGVEDIHPMDSLGQVKADFELQVRGEKVMASELPCLRKDGTVFIADIASSVAIINGKKCLMGFFADVSDRIRAVEEKAKLDIQLRQFQKFEAIGTLAGGIAHDFNNLLMGIQGRASLISLDLEASHPHRGHINAIEEYIRSATNLTKQLLGLARGGKYEVKPIDINELVLGSSAMFGRTKKEIQIHTKCQESSLVVEADRGQIEQVLLNMYINAWQAMPPTGGDIYLETKIVKLDETYCKSRQIETGLYIKVSVTDTGSGMDETTRLQVFDPFFTTKDKGRGTGLGMASAYGIIKNHGGIITVYSEIGHGTTFNIYLPQSWKQSQPESPVEREIKKGTENILLVDDEELIIDVGQAMLEMLGYRVIIARNGQEAIHLIMELGKQIDLVILDMIMPEMDGETTFERIREIQPDLPVLLSSGYAINGQADKIMRRGCNGFIQKPYNISEFSQKIRKVLDEAIKASSDA
jgi:PAS domain S-box-containing protein